METKRTVYSNSLRKMKRRLERVVHCIVFLRTRSVSTSLEFIYALNANNRDLGKFLCCIESQSKVLAH